MNEVRTMTAPPDQISNVMIYMIPDKISFVNETIQDKSKHLAQNLCVEKKKLWNFKT